MIRRARHSVWKRTGVAAMALAMAVVLPRSVGAAVPAVETWLPFSLGDCEHQTSAQDEGSPAKSDGAHERSAPDDEQQTWLTIGDRAPKMEISYWLKGREIDSLSKGQATVLIFWASWSMPARNIVPGISSLQAEYEKDDVTIIVLSDERPQTLVKYLAEPGVYDAMGVSIATDPKRTMQRAYMDAAAIGSIPSAFLIGDDGLIEWIGHPRDLAAPLEAVVRGTWDRAVARAEFEREIAPARELFVRMRAMKSAFRDENWPRLLDMFDEAIAATEDNTSLKIQKFQLMIGAMNRPETGYAYGRTLLKEFWDDALALNNLAWYVVDYERVRTRDLEFAMTAASRAAELTKNENAAILDTVARVYFEQGDLSAALDWQRQAVRALRPGDSAADSVRRALARYEKKAREGRDE